MTMSAGGTGGRPPASVQLTGDWPAPAPGAAPMRQMVAAQAGLELRTLLRNGEQLLLTLIIPVLLLIAFGHENLVSIGSGRRIDFVVPGILALTVLSTAFTSLAIGTGFERRYGVLKRLGAAPLSRTGLIAAKTLTVLVVEAAQAVIVLAVGAALGWSPHASPAAVAWVPLLLLAGTAAFSGLALLLAGTVRAEATLAAANLIYLILLGLGGVLFPLTKFPAGLQPVLKLLPAGALSDGLRSVLAHSGSFPAADVLVLCLWAAVAIGLAARTFRWE
jgi:ABC-2 type transport system permease protein